MDLPLGKREDSEGWPAELELGAEWEFLMLFVLCAERFYDMMLESVCVW